MRVTITIQDDTPPDVATAFASRSIQHWHGESKHGRYWSQGAIIRYSHGVNSFFTSTKQTAAGWTVRVWRDE